MNLQQGKKDEKKAEQKPASIKITDEQNKRLDFFITALLRSADRLMKQLYTEDHFYETVTYAWVGENARLAVECDGDQYHTLEKWEEDQIRERQLRRAGWEFWRVSGSSFYRHKEKALDSLWEKLDELGINPIV